MKIEKLEDLNAWVEARKLAQLVFEVVRELPSEEKYGVKRHMLENARGVPANIAEGFGRFYYQESVQFYRVARGCLEEQRNDVYICLDRGYLDEELAQKLFGQIEIVKKLTNGLIGSARKAKSEAEQSLITNNK